MGFSILKNIIKSNNTTLPSVCLTAEITSKKYIKERGLINIAIMIIINSASQVSSSSCTT